MDGSTGDRLEYLFGGALTEITEDIDNIYDQVVEVAPISSGLNGIVPTGELSAAIPDALQGIPLAGLLQGLKMLDHRLAQSDEPKAE